MSRRSLSRRSLAGVLWAAGYGATLGLLLAGLLYLRGWAMRELSRPQAVAEWQAWKAQTQKEAGTPGPVKRRPVTSDEPPTLILLRDRFWVIALVCGLIATVLFLFLAIVVRGASGPPRGIERSQ